MQISNCSIDKAHTGGKTMLEMYMLEQLAAVKEYGTLSAASEVLHLTQPSLSRSMQKLEDLLGVKLFERTKNRLTLNENGRLAAEYAKRILDEEQAMIRQVRALDRSRHTISIGTIAPGPIMELSPLLSSHFSEMTVSMEIRDEETLLRGLQQGTYQMIILNHRLEDEALRCHPCGSEHLYVRLSPNHALADREEVRFSDLNGESFLMVKEVGFWDSIVRENMPESRFLLQDDTAALSELILASALPSFATDLTLRIYGSVENTVYLPITDEAALTHYYCYCKTGDEMKYLAWFQMLERRFK